MAGRDQTFRTVLEATGGKNVAFVVPDEVIAAFGRGKRVPVSVRVGQHTWTTTTGSMGGRSLVSFNAATRATTGLGAGDEVEVTLTLDDAPRTVEPPAPLAAALAEDPDAAAAWAALSPSRQKAHALAVESARTDATRERRLAAVLADLRA